MLETADLILDKGKLQDWRSLYDNLWSQKEVARYMLWRVKETEAQGKEMTAGYLDFQATDPTAYVVYEKSGGQAIGIAGMKEMEPGVFQDSGIAIGPSFAGRGYGKQILSALLHQAFDELGAKRFIYSCWAENIPSNKLALSCGLCFSHAEEAVDGRTNEGYTLNYYEKIK